MEATQVRTWRRGEAPRYVKPQPARAVDAQGQAADLDRVRRLARLLDAQFEVAGVRFGLDSLIGLVPVLGDSITTLIGLYPIWVAQQHKVGFFTRARMVGNLALDWAVGLVPLVGDVFDVGFKANLRNLELLEKALQKKAEYGVE
jgi:hypothetical protein